MKGFNFTSLLVCLLVSLPICSIAQDDIIDEGLTPLYITVPLDDFSENLTKTEVSKVWFDNVEDGYTLGRYLFDIESLESKEYFGLPVERIEIKSNWFSDYSEETDEYEEYVGIREFFLFTDLPSEEEFNAFSTRILDKYGPIRSFAINDDDSETPEWFSSNTMMTFTNYDAPFVSPDGKKYILVKYRCAFGG